MTRTNGDARATKAALDFIGNSLSKSEKLKPAAYNALMLRILMASEAYKPLVKAIDDTERQIVDRYLLLAGNEAKYNENGSIFFGGRLDREFMREQAALLDAPVEDEPRRRPFTLGDFDAVGIAVPQIIQSQLGVLLTRPDVDPDVLP
ncbi:MAG: hypothetical protein M3R13_12170 [Armatimonadota bacterium]|nr:hypothetical protein [Armatimonadota bacterium]